MSKLCIVDIDGVLNYYPECFVEFVNDKLEKNCMFLYGSKFRDLREIKKVIPFEVYKNIKEEYRISEFKENLKVRVNAKKMLRTLKENGYLIVLMTSRPIFENQRVFELTVNWLNKNGLAYDDLFFTDKKNYAIMKYFNEVDFIIEDNFYNASALSGLVKEKVFLIENDYNKDNEKIEKVEVVKNLKEIIDWVKEKKNASK